MASLKVRLLLTSLKYGNLSRGFAHRILHTGSFSGKSTLNEAKLQSLAIQSAIPVGTHATKVIFNDSQTCDVKFIWLRDNCGCPACVHPETRQKMLDTPSLDINMRPKFLSVSANGDLQVDWPDDHQSVYPANWLHRHALCFAQDSFQVGEGAEKVSHLPAIQLWDRTSIWTSLPEISYREVMNTDNGLKSWLQMIHKFGLAIIKGVPTNKDEVIQVVNRFAYVKETSYGLTFDVISDPDPNAHLAYTGLRLELHTDMNYREKSPGLQLLHCLRGAEDGHKQSGCSFFVDGFHAARWLQLNQPAAFHVLASTPIKFSITTKNLKYSQHWPIICVDKDGEVTEIHCNNRTMGPLQAPSHLVLAFYHAYKMFTEKLRDPSMELMFQMQPGDLVAFNNRRVLHGRTGFDPRYVRRHLQGCYVDIDEVMSRYELLLAQ